MNFIRENGSIPRFPSYLRSVSHPRQAREEGSWEGGWEGEIGITLEKHGKLYQLALAGRLHDALSASRTPD